MLKSSQEEVLKPTSNETSIREQILTEALSIVTKDRNQSYGNPEDNFRDIANLWTEYLYKEIQPYQVADMMILMKIARNRHRPGRDNYVDIAGYAACGAECAHV